jgi:hypothetical protein
MTSQCEPLKGLKCHITDSDSIPVEELYNTSNSFGGQLLLFCERKHVLSFFKNPGDNLLRPSNISQYYSTLPENYPNFFKNSNDVVFERFTDIINLRQVEYWSGTCFAIRLFLETLIYDNYGTYAWYRNMKLRSKTDKDKIEDVHNKIRSLGFETFMTIIISSTWRTDLINRNLYLCENRYHLKDDRLSYAVEAATNLQKVSDSVHWISKNTLKSALEAFKTLSPHIHSKEIVDPAKIDDSLIHILNAYEEFYSYRSSWGVIYE